MKKIFLIAVVPIIMGVVGFFAGQFFMASPSAPQAPLAVADGQHEILFKLPLGKFTFQVLKPGRIVHIRINMDIYIAGAAEFENINGSLGRSRLRDAIIAIVSDLAESTLWVKEGTEQDIDQDQLIKEIIQKLYKNFPMVRTARFNQFDTSRSARH